MEIYIKAPANRSTAQLMKTGQLTSYQSGDDGNIQAGRSVSFTALSENNVFGNTTRFTDELGGQTYTKNIVIDWSTYNGGTVLGWRRTSNGANISWSNAISGALSVSISPFLIGWRLPNIIEMMSLSNYGIATSLCLNYTPFNLNSSNRWWTSNTLASSTTVSYYFNETGEIIQIAKSTTTNMRYIPCRLFTVIGTTLS